MSTALRTGLFGALAAALLLWAWLGREPRAAPPAAAAPEPAAEGPAADERAAELDEPHAPLRTPVAPPPLPPPPEVTDSTAPTLGEELAPDLQAEVPAGALVVVVQQDGRPLAGARVLLHGLAQGGPPQELEGLLENGSSAVTGANGVAAFWGLGPDTYNLRVFARHLPVLEITAVHTAESRARVLAAYGTSAVEGKVYDVDGVPLDACWILVRSQNAPGGGQWSHMWASTGADGAYRIDGLLAGVAWIKPTCEGEESVSVVLEPGALQRVDFGWPGGAPTWKGTVRGLDGAAVDVPGQLTGLRHENGERSQFAYGPDGSFEARLRPGRYTIQASGYEGSYVVGDVEIPLQGLARDLTLPLARVMVELDYVGSQPDPARVLERVHIRLRRTPEWGGVVAEALAGGRFVFRGVPPGDYFLAAGSQLVGPGVLADSGALPLTVPPGTAVVHARIAIGDPPGAKRP